jgi:Flp pilus assembly protein TadD
MKRHSIVIAMTLVFSWQLAQHRAVAAATGTCNLQVIEMKLANNGIASSDVERLADYLTAHPKDAHAHFLAGKIYEHQGLTELAGEEFEKADHLAPNQSDSILESFVSKMEGNDEVGAMQDFAYLSQRFPKDPAVLLMWSMIYSGKGQPQFAEAYMSQALSATPSRVGVAAAAGSMRLEQHRNDEALELAKRDLSKAPRNYLANAVAGQACMRLGKRDEGGRYLRTAFEVRPLEKINDNAFATSFYRAGMYGDALAPALVYMTSCVQPADLATAKIQVEMILRQLPPSECENVALMVDRLFQKSPFRSRFHLALGDAYDRLGWVTEAEHHYMAGIGIDPSVARAWYRLGLDYQQQGKMKAARFLFERARFLAPEDADIRFACQRVSEREHNKNNDLARSLKEAIANWKK